MILKSIIKKTAKTKNKDKNLKEKGEVGKAYYLNNHLSLSVCFSLRSLKHQSHHQPHTSPLVSAIQHPQIHLAGVKIEA